MLGSFYISIKIFFTNYFSQLTDSTAFAEKFPNLWKFFNDPGSFGFTSIFAYFYVILLIITVLTSIAAPIDRAMSYFRLIAAIFSVLTMMSLIGIAVFMGHTGFFPEEQTFNTKTRQWEDDGV